jgi:hypothetical protein
MPADASYEMEGIVVRKRLMVRIGLIMSSVAALVLAGGASKGLR